MTAEEIKKVLREERHFAMSEDWLVFEEVRCGSGYGRHQARSIDLWAVKVAPSAGNQAIAYEVKVSRSDFIADIRDSHKQRGALTFSDRFYYVAPVGVIPVEKLPAWAGLIEIEDELLANGKRHRVVVDAYPRNKCAPSWPFLVSVIRNAERRGRSEG